MQQVIDNIISNSYKYAGTKITIKSQINQGYLELHIIDFGSGISEEELPLLFNKYYRGKMSKARMVQDLVFIYRSTSWKICMAKLAVTTEKMVLQ